jgi:hypothetical protein
MKKSFSRSAKVTASALLICLLGKTASASIDYGNFTGTNFQYVQVTEGSVTSTPPLYGPPIVVGNALVFNPVDFGASASNGGVQITDGTLTTQITALPGSFIDQIQLSEAGDYTLAGAPAAVTTSVSVAAPVFLQIVKLNGVGITPIDVNADAIFTPNGGSYNLLNNAGAGIIWNGALSESIDAAIAAAGQTGRATEVIYTMDNDLTAISQSGTIAFIQKKTNQGVTITTSMPEPASIGMLAFAAVGVLKRRQRS